MKVTRDTPDQLILDDTPWLVGLVLAAMILACAAIGLSLLGSGHAGRGLAILGFGLPFLGLFFGLFVRRNQLILDRVAGKVIHRRATVLGRTEVVHYLDNLDRAIIQTSRGKNGDTYRMTLVLSGGMDAGLHPFTRVYSSGRGARRGAEAVNRWLARARPPVP